jgi:Ca-activated chloride channel family protein
VIFADPHWLWLLVPVGALAAWRVWRARRRPAPGVRFSDVTAARAVPVSLAVRLRWLPAALRLGALALAVLALARPQERDVTRTRCAEGIDIMLVLDTSTSMRAEDFQPNRFEAARDVAAEFIDSRVSDRVGLIVFAAQAYTQAPLTLDYRFLQTMLREVRVGVIRDGTAIGTALALAANRLKDTAAKTKVVILLTDGQNNRGEIDPLTAAEVAEALNVRVYAIGVGTRGEAPFVVNHPFAGQQRRMMRVEIDEEMLTSVADATGGRYFRATSKEGLREVYDEIGQLEKTKIETRVYTERTERYPWFAWPAFALVVLDLLLAATLFRRLP